LERVKLEANRFYESKKIILSFPETLASRQTKEHHIQESQFRTDNGVGNDELEFAVNVEKTLILSRQKYVLESSNRTNFIADTDVRGPILIYSCSIMESVNENEKS
jgi:hypothetical protein